MAKILIAVWLLFGLASAQAQTNPVTPPCRADKIDNASGRMIRLKSGQIFQGYPGSQRTTSTWTPLDKVSVCQIGGTAVTITNLSNRNQSIKALRYN